MKILDCKKIDEKNHERVTFIRIDPENINITLKEMFLVLADLSWIASFDQEFIKQSFFTRAEPTIKELEFQILANKNDELTGDVAEYIISELSREALVNELNYLDIPLAELLGRKVKGNPGFDFYSENEVNTILFGEAKYVAAQNSYGRALSQVNKFVDIKKDIADLILIRDFCSQISLNNACKGVKGFVIGFSAKGTSSDDLIDNIVKNSDYQKLRKFHELIFVAVNL